MYNHKTNSKLDKKHIVLPGIAAHLFSLTIPRTKKTEEWNKTRDAMPTRERDLPSLAKQILLPRTSESVPRAKALLIIATHPVNLSGLRVCGDSWVVWEHHDGRRRAYLQIRGKHTFSFSSKVRSVAKWGKTNRRNA